MLDVIARIWRGAFDMESTFSRSPQHNRCRIIIADDDVVMLCLLRVLLDPEFYLVGTASSLCELVAVAREQQADVILLDAALPRSGGLEAGRALRAHGVDARLVYLASKSDADTAAQAFALGASEFVVKPATACDLLHVLQVVAAGGRYLVHDISGGVTATLSAALPASPVKRLSAREFEVLKLLVTGMPMKAVARTLGIVPRTVAFHKYHAMKTLDLHGNAELVDFAVRNGLLGNDEHK